MVDIIIGIIFLLCLVFVGYLAIKIYSFKMPHDDTGDWINGGKGYPVDPLTEMMKDIRNNRI